MIVKKYLLFIIIALVTTACVKDLPFGSVNQNTRNYKDLIRSNNTKIILYNCDFSKIATQSFKQFGDYCGKNESSDYLSYMVPFDIQSTNGFRNYLIAVTANTNKDDNTYKKYYINYALKDNVNNVIRKRFKNTPPTSFVLQTNNNNYAVVLTKEDLLFRTDIEATQYILGLNEDNATGKLSIKYQLASDIFEILYDNDKIGRLLSLPPLSYFKGKDNKTKLNNYNNQLNAFWDKNNLKYSLTDTSPIDYAIPTVGQAKFRVLKQKKNTIPLNLTATDEVLASGYLPNYMLESIQIIHVDNGENKIVRTFTRKDILNTVLSMQDSPLIYKGTIAALTKIRFKYRALPPIKDNLDRATMEYLGLGYIYSNIAQTIIVDIAAASMFKLSELPLGCINVDKLRNNLTSGGLKEEEIIKLISTLSDKTNADCSYNFESMGKYLHMLL